MNEMNWFWLIFHVVCSIFFGFNVYYERKWPKMCIWYIFMCALQVLCIFLRIMMITQGR